MKRKRITRSVWAIEAGLPNQAYLLGKTGDFPAVYWNRRRARSRLGSLKSSNVLPRAARAVRVSLTIVTIGRG